MVMRSFSIFLLILVSLSTRAYANCEDNVRNLKYDPKTIRYPLPFLDPKPDDRQNGLVTDQVRINVPNLIAGYSQGLFAYFSDDNAVGRWYNPPDRGILRLDQVHFGSRNLRWIRNKLASGELRLTFNQAFEEVIKACADIPRSTGEWISPTHIAEYNNLHKAGFAHSVEVWRGRELVGGLYFVYVNGVASGESMFSVRDEQGRRQRNIMMLAYWGLIEELSKSVDGYPPHEFIDAQMNIGLSQLLGGQEVSRNEFMRYLRRSQRVDRPISPAFRSH